MLRRKKLDRGYVLKNPKGKKGMINKTKREKRYAEKNKGEVY